MWELRSYFQFPIEADVAEHITYLPKGACLSWDHQQIWAQTSADLLMVFVSTLLSIVIYFVLKRHSFVRDDRLMRRIYWAYLAVIFVFGVEKCMNISVMWYPLYPWQTICKWISACIVSGSAIFIASMLPRGLLRRERILQVAHARGNRLSQKIREQEEALTQSRTGLVQEIHDLEVLLHKHNTFNSVSANQLVIEIRKVIGELREHPAVE